jgi:hypothetical protein
MLDLATPQQLDLFNTFAKQWLQATGSELLFLSVDGDILASSNGKIPIGGQDLLKLVSPHSSNYFSYSQHRILAAPLTQGNQTYGYLLALDAKAGDASLLEWGAQNIVARVVDSHALQNMTDELIGAWDQLSRYRESGLDLGFDGCPAIDLNRDSKGGGYGRRLYHVASHRRPGLRYLSLNPG